MMTPQFGQDERVQELLDQLLRFYQDRPGFITAYRLAPDAHAETKRVGRISVWESEDDAHRTANEQRDMAIQSELKLATQDATHEEHSFTGVQAE